MNQWSVSMKTCAIILLCLAGVAFSLWNTSEMGMAEVIDKIAAIVDENLILLSELREYAAMPVVSLVANLDASEDVEQATLAYIVERRLLMREVQYLAVPREDDVLNLLARQYIATRYHRDLQSFAEKFEVSGISEVELAQELTVYMQGMDYIRRRYRFTEEVENPEIILNLFQTWVDALRAQATVNVLL
jgi:hypothetical protein